MPLELVPEQAAPWGGPDDSGAAFTVGSARTLPIPGLTAAQPNLAWPGAVEVTGTSAV